MKKGVSKELRKALATNHSAYVLITCGSPSDDGRMNVEMTYEGDPALAAYLLQTAQSFVEEDPDDLPGHFCDDLRRVQ